MTNDMFYKKMMAIAIPVALQTLLTSLLNTLDTIMISSLGDASIAGVGLANQYFFLFTFICFGINTGSSVLFAQYWGIRDRQQVARVNQLSLLLGVGVGLFFSILGSLMPYFLVGLLIQDPVVVQAGGDYLRVAAITYVITAFSFSIGNAMRSTGNPKTPLVATAISFVANAFFNYVFIFGKFGFPMMGVVGAALGTLVARMIESAVLIIVTMKYQGPIHIPFLKWERLSKDFVQLYLRTTIPVIINESGWALGNVLYSAAYAMVGTQATAAVQVAVAVQNLIFVIVRGLGSSCSIMLGNSIGKNKIGRARDDAKRFLCIALGVGIVIGLVESLTPQWTLLLFGNLSSEVFEIGKQLLHIMGIIFVLKSINSIIVVGILRGGGDTTYAMKLDLLTVWLVGVPLSLVAAGVFHFGILIVFICAAMEDVVKSIFGLLRVKSGQWVHRLV